VNAEFWVKAPSRVQRIQLQPQDLAEIQAHAGDRATITRDETGTWTISFRWGSPLTCQDGDWVVDLGWDPWQPDATSVLTTLDAWGRPAYQKVTTAAAVYSTEEPPA
jgi:hypothetical protein